MHLISRTPRHGRRDQPRRAPVTTAAAPAPVRARILLGARLARHLHTLPRPGDEHGYMLLEVIVSALLVGMIVVGTFTGFDAANDANATERAHAQAVVLVAQDEERLRGLTSTEIAQLGTTAKKVAANGVCVEEKSAGSNTWQYCTGTSFAGQTYTGTVFTITSSSKYVSAETSTFTCETSGGQANYIQTTSSATWPKARSAVSQSSIVATPTSSVLIVKVKNQNSEAVEGATVVLTTGTSSKTTQTTGSSGCVTFGGLAAETDKVAVEKSGWVSKGGEASAEKEVSIVANKTATEELTLAESGAISATFISEESAAEKEKAVPGDTFVAFQSHVLPTPENFVEGTAGKYEPITSSITLKNLFPFAKLKEKVWEPEGYTVYAGDCTANNPETVTAGTVKAKEALVKPGSPTAVKVEAPPIKLKVYEGTEKTKKNLIASSTSAEIKNTECSGKNTHNHGTLTAAQTERSVALSSGELTNEYRHQPYAKSLTICVATEKIEKKYRKYEGTVENTKKAGVEKTLWMMETTSGYTSNEKEKESCT